MTGRLLNWPIGLRPNYREPLTGPRAVGASSTQSLTGFSQTTASPFGTWRWRFGFPRLKGQLFRRYRGMVTALHGGANAVRVSFCDWDGLSYAQRGIITTPLDRRRGVPWGNGEAWSNGLNWSCGDPLATVAASAAVGDTLISLTGDAWGHRLDIGDWIGFLPFATGLYMVTDVIDDGEYRIWPPLRTALTTDSRVTLKPTMVMRLEGEDAATAGRGPASAEGVSITLVEVPDYDVRDYFDA